MTEAIKQLEIRDLPLSQLHERLGSVMCVRDGWTVPASYGDRLFEYAAVRESGAGLIDLSSRGRLIVRGTEAIQFLNGLITNDMKTLALNSWMPAAFPNVQGRLIASVRVIRLKDDVTGKNPSPTFMLDTEAATHERVLKTIERFTLAGDFQVDDITNRTGHLTVQGKKAGEIVRAVMGDEAAGLGPNAAIQTTDQQTEVTVIHATHTAEEGFDLIVSLDQANILWNSLSNAGARPVGYDAFEMLRIEAGVPRFGADMDETNIVTEAGLDTAVSYTKGCYVGQEIIARIKYRGHVARKLSGLSFDQPRKVEAGALIKSQDDKEIGRITSATYSPHLGRTIALAYLKYDYIPLNTIVTVIAGDDTVAAVVTDLPFVRGRST